jgi:hypothetical protein
MNMNTVLSDGDGECGGWNFGIGSLVLSLGITLILVGALFYYVKQRIEVLETSQKEQIHVMQGFIASIGEQFQRMTAYVQEKVGFGAPRPPGSAVPVPEQPISISISNSRINISDSDSTSESSNSDSETDSDSEYDSSDNSRSSNTTRDSDSDRYTKSPQINIHEVSDTIGIIDSDTMDNVKIIELTPAQIESHHEKEQDSESESESDSETESESESESESDSVRSDTNVPIHVTKIDSEQGQKKTLVIDLDGELDGQVGIGIATATTSNTSSTTSDYATLTIKQLRQLLKKKNPSMLMNDIAKMKREQIVEMLQM